MFLEQSVFYHGIKTGDLEYSLLITMILQTFKFRSVFYLCVLQCDSLILK